MQRCWLWQASAAILIKNRASVIGTIIASVLKVVNPERQGTMLKSEFNFDLPEELIAQYPCEPRDAARLLYMNRETGTIQHKVFTQLTQLLQPGDLLVLNNSKVLPARLIGQRNDEGAVCELLLLRQLRQDVWECLAKPGRKLRPGVTVSFGDGSLTATVLETLENGGKIVQFTYNTQTLYEKLDEFGQMPLPPYIQSRVSKEADYQTVYAKELGSAAAPTAGLHFTKELLKNLENMGVKQTELTLHVGLGTFRPMQEEKVENHVMHSEWYSISEEAANAINQTKANGGRIIAVGTTSCRTLESVAARFGQIQPASGDTDIFITPGYQFKAIDGLITNFHLPESTLIMLVSAFCGYENTMNAYKIAVQEKYRFFSFGDAMLLL